MKLRIFTCLTLTLTLYLSAAAQKFPFDITPLSSPPIVNAKKPIESVSSKPFQNMEVYRFSTNCVLQGITFNNVFLDFENNRLTKMTFPIKNDQEAQIVIKALSTKYKKESNCNFNTPHCYRNGDLLIYFIKLEAPDVVNNRGYLYYEYQATDSF